MIESYLKKLITFKTVSGDQRANLKALKWVKKELSFLPLDFRFYRSNGFSSLLITTPKRKNPKVLLLSHIDVVSGSKELFSPKKKNNMLYGRGVFDMNFATACYIHLLKDLGRELSKYDLGVLLTTDEELGGINGTGVLAKKIKPKVCILPDGGENWTMQRSAKGILHLHVSSSGLSGHGSRPWVGINAIERLQDFLIALRKLFLKEPCRTKDHDHDTLNIGRIIGGKSGNTIPDFAEAELDIRVAREEKRSELEKRIRSLAVKFKTIAIDQGVSASGYEIDMTDSYIALFIEHLRAKLGYKPKFIRSHGSSDARFFALKKIPVILLRPVGGGLHSEKEWIDLKSLNSFYEVLKRYVKEVADIHRPRL